MANFELTAQRRRVSHFNEMTMTPHIEADSPDFPGDPTPQPPFGLRDSLRSLFLWSIALPHVATWTTILKTLSKIVALKQVDPLLKFIALVVPLSTGVRFNIKGGDSLGSGGPYVYVANHVNIFDIFALYRAIPDYARGLELIDHFSWPIVGPLITTVGQIPVDPSSARMTALSLRKAYKMLQAGESVTVLPEGSRTLDGSVGPFLQGAFRIAIRASVPVVPIAIRAGRAISRRGDWRIRPGVEEVLIGKPIPTDDLKIKDAQALADKSRQVIIDLLQGRMPPE